MRKCEESDENLENAETMTEIVKKIDGEDCYFIDSEETNLSSLLSISKP